MGFPLKIPSIPSYGDFAKTTWSVILDVNTMVESTE